MRFSTFAIVSAILVPALAVAAEPKTVDVVMTEIPAFPKPLPRFEPSKVEINVGDTVRWTNKGFLPHTVDEGKDCSALAGGQSFTSGLMPVIPGGVFTHMFDKAGEFPYFCKPHCVGGSMTGIVIVK